MSFRDKTREWKTRLKAGLQGMLGDDSQSMPPKPTLDPTATLRPTEEQSSSSSHPPSAAAWGSTGLGNLSWLKSEGWENLTGCMYSLNHVATTSGLGPLKVVIEGLIECICIYEDVARGRQAFTSLRTDLELTFEQLHKYITLSPTVAMNISSVCEYADVRKLQESESDSESNRLMQKEIDYVKSQQERSRTRRLKEAEEDEDKVLDCYKRIRDQLRNLSLSLSVSTLAIVEQHAMDDRLRELTPSLSAHYDSGNATVLKRGSCTEGTRTGVLGGMHEWVTGQNTGNIYWMSGMAGTGKTTIAYSLCEWLNAERSGILGASFFCSRLLPECRSVGKIIPSIVYQLAQRFRSFQYALCQAMKSNPNAHVGAPALQFETLLMGPLSDGKVQATLPRNIVVVIDALDECEDTTCTRQILGVLLASSKSLPIKFVVSSRPEPAIREQMDKNATWVDARVVLHEIASGEVQTDIRTYLKAELAPINPSELQIEQLVTRAGVFFIYAATVIRYVGYDDFGRDPKARLQIVLGALKHDEQAPTNDIDDLYTTILRAALDDPMLSKKERGTMKLVLDTVICARTPLTVSALNNLLKMGNVSRVQAALRPLWSVLHVMGPDLTVTTLHASFPDYLLDSTRSGAWHCDAGAQHNLLAQRCFEYIRDTKPQFNICRLESSYLIDDEIPGFDIRIQELISTELRYACQYWASHLHAAEPSTAYSLVLALTQFLTTHLLLWMEVRNLTKTMATTLGELMMVKDWAKQRDMSRDAFELLSDAWRFASIFISSPVSQSTPHLYVSMLPLLPSYSSIRKHYYGRFRGLIVAEGTAMDRRQEALLAQWKFDLRMECMACSPDGALVAIGGGSQRIGGYDRMFLLDAFSGNVLLDLSQGCETRVHSIAFSPDSTRLVSGSEDGVISFWDVTNGQPALAPFKAHDYWISAILFSHDAAHVISASRDKTIRIWDAASGEPAFPLLIEHPDKVTCIAISTDDARLASGSRDGTIHLWDMQSGQLVLDPIVAHEAEIIAIAFTSDDSYIVSGSRDCSVRVFDSRTGHLTLTRLLAQDAGVTSVSISPDSATIAFTTVHFDGVQILDAASGSILSQLGPLSQELSFKGHASYLTDGARILVSDGGGVLRVLDTQSTAKSSDPLSGHSTSITSSDISPNGRHAVFGLYDHTLYMWDLIEATMILGPLHGHTDVVNMVAFSKDGSRIVSCAWDSTIQQWEAQSGATHSTPIHVASAMERGVISANYSPDGTAIASITDRGTLSVWDSSSGQLILGPIEALGQSDGVCAEYSTDGTIVIAGYRDGTIGAWDVQSGRMVYRHRGDRESLVSSLAFSPDGLYYAQSFANGRISLRNIYTGEQVPGDFEGHTEYIACLRFSKNGSRLVSGSRDQTVQVWDVQTGRSMFGPLRGHTGWVRAVVFSPDSNYVVSVSEDLAVRVWDVQPRVHSSKEGDIEYANWTLNEDGWVVSGKPMRLLWAPGDLHTSLMSPRNTAVISRDGKWQLRFDGALIGEAWAKCWCGN